MPQAGSRPLSARATVQDAVARFTDERVRPIIGDAFDQARFPKELVPEIAELGLLGSSLPEKYGCAGLNAVSYGLICQELERGDSGIRSFVSVQSSLCMYPIYAYGSEEQKQRDLAECDYDASKATIGDGKAPKSTDDAVGEGVLEAGHGSVGSENESR